MPDQSIQRWLIPCIGLVMGVAGVACSNADRTVALTPDCQVELGGVSYFLGEERCYRLYSERKMSGFWVSGHEYSAFYSDRASIPAGFDPPLVWLNLSEGAHATAEPYLDGTRKILEISFHGIEPGIDGIYGHHGMSKRGVFVESFLTLKEVK